MHKFDKWKRCYLTSLVFTKVFGRSRTHKTFVRKVLRTELVVYFRAVCNASISSALGALGAQLIELWYRFFLHFIIELRSWKLDTCVLWNLALFIIFFTKERHYLDPFFTKMGLNKILLPYFKSVQRGCPAKRFLHFHVFRSQIRSWSSGGKPQFPLFKYARNARNALIQQSLN